MSKWGLSGERESLLIKITWGSCETGRSTSLPKWNSEHWERNTSQLENQYFFPPPLPKRIIKKNFSWWRYSFVVDDVALWKVRFVIQKPIKQTYKLYRLLPFCNLFIFFLYIFIHLCIYFMYVRIWDDWLRLEEPLYQNSIVPVLQIYLSSVINKNSSLFPLLCLDVWVFFSVLTPARCSMTTVISNWRNAEEAGCLLGLQVKFSVTMLKRLMLRLLFCFLNALQRGLMDVLCNYKHRKRPNQMSSC